jgi:hypothetical protein
MDANERRHLRPSSSANERKRAPTGASAPTAGQPYIRLCVYAYGKMGVGYLAKIPLLDARRRRSPAGREAVE